MLWITMKANFHGLMFQGPWITRLSSSVLVLSCLFWVGAFSVCGMKGLMTYAALPSSMDSRLVIWGTGYIQSRHVLRPSNGTDRIEKSAFEHLNDNSGKSNTQ